MVSVVWNAEWTESEGLNCSFGRGVRACQTEPLGYHPLEFPALARPPIARPPGPTYLLRTRVSPTRAKRSPLTAHRSLAFLCAHTESNRRVLGGLRAEVRGERLAKHGARRAGATENWAVACWR